MKCLWCMSLLLSPPHTGNKEINKGLYSGTSSFSVSAGSIKPEPRCVLVVRRPLYPTNLIRRGLAVWRIRRWAINVALCPVAQLASTKDKQGRERMQGPLWVGRLDVRPIRSFADKSGIADWPISWSGRRVYSWRFFLFCLWFMMSRNMQSLGQNSLCATYKNIHCSIAELFISEPLCMAHWRNCPRALYVIYVLLPH